MRVLLAALALFLAVCAPAGASTVTYMAGFVEPAGTPPEESCSRYMQCPPGSVTFHGGPGEANAVSVTTGPGTLVFRDAGAPLAAGEGCAAQPDGSVSCPGAQITVDLGDGDDRIESTTPLFVVLGGDGNDAIAGAVRFEGGNGDDTLTGGAAGERFVTGAGNDTVNAGGGDDTLVDDGAVDSDVLDGGDGGDEITFTERDTPVRVDLAARPQDAGSEGEGNVVTNIERASGGRGPDVLISDPAAPATSLFVLSGLEGDDRLEIRGAGAKVNGGPGGDEVVGGPGNDTIDGGTDSDTLSGGGGNDLLLGDLAPDEIDGGAGRDTITGGDGADRLTGGGGNDRIGGGIGRDVIRGEAGADVLNGGGGNDRLFGGGGRDQLFGDSGIDVLAGDADGDRLVGGTGPDRVSGGTGADVVSVADRSRDRVDCGAARDRVTLDRRDRSSRCETVRRR